MWIKLWRNKMCLFFLSFYFFNVTGNLIWNPKNNSDFKKKKIWEWGKILSVDFNQFYDICHTWIIYYVVPRAVARNE